MAFTRMPYLALATAVDCTNAFMAAFEHLYATVVPYVQSAAMDDTAKMTPLPCARITGRVCFAHRKKPVVLISCMRSQPSRVRCIGGASPSATPTL